MVKCLVCLLMKIPSYQPIKSQIGDAKEWVVKNLEKSDFYNELIGFVSGCCLLFKILSYSASDLANLCQDRCTANNWFWQLKIFTSFSYLQWISRTSAAANYFFFSEKVACNLFLQYIVCKTFPSSCAEFYSTHPLYSTSSGWLDEAD